MKSKYIKGGAWGIMIISLLVLIGLFIFYCRDYYSVYNEKIDFEITGQFGDFVGGFIGTLISAAGFLFLYLTLKEQRENFSKERFESKFFDLMKIHRENVSELFYDRTDKGNEKVTNKEVFKYVFADFYNCFREIKKYTTTTNPDDIILPKYKARLLEIKKRVNNKINLIELCQIDIAYCIVFYGVEDEGEIILRDRFKHQYEGKYYYKLLKYIRLKPQAIEGSDLFENWIELKSFRNSRIRNIVNEIYKNRRNIINATLSEEAEKLKPNYLSKKYYVGHQSSLGHYFRHLFQCYKFINESDFLVWDEKYLYGKILRAQLSTYEQALLFVNSISSLGMKWEYIPDGTIDSNLNKKELDVLFEKKSLISNYHIIKNLSGNHFSGLTFKKYYPKVNYEASELRKLTMVNNQ